MVGRTKRAQNGRSCRSQAGVVQAAANTLNVAADAYTIACNLLGTIDWALETGLSFEEVAEELLAQIQFTATQVLILCQVIVAMI